MTTVERSTDNMTTKIFSLLLLVLAAARSEDRSQKKRGIFGEHQEQSSLGNSFGSLNSGGSSSSWKPIIPSYGASSSNYGSNNALSSYSLPAVQSSLDHGSSGSLASGHHQGIYSHDSGASSHAHLGDFSNGNLSPIPQPPIDLSSAQLSAASFQSQDLSPSALSHEHVSSNSFPSGGISLNSLSGSPISALQSADAAQLSAASFQSQDLSPSALSHEHGSSNSFPSGGVSLNSLSGSPISAFQSAEASGLGLSSGLGSNGALLSSGSLYPSFAAGDSSFGGLSPAQFSTGNPAGVISSGSPFPAGLSSNGLSSGDFSSLPTLGVGAPISIGRHITITNRVAVPVPQPYPVTVHRDVPVPVHHTVQVPVSRPVPVPVAKPYPVTVVKHVPYAVEKRVPYPVPHPVPYAVYKPVPVHIAKPVAVPVVKEVPYPVAKPYIVYQQKEASSWR